MTDTQSLLLAFLQCCPRATFAEAASALGCSVFAVDLAAAGLASRGLIVLQPWTPEDEDVGGEVEF
jgi:hypothetical protein